MKEITKLFRIYRTVTLSIFLIFGSIMAVLYGIIPGFKTIQAIYIDTRNLEDEVNGIKKRVNILSAQDPRLLDNYMNLLLSAIPVEKNLDTILTTLDGVTVQSQMTELNFEIEKPGSIATSSGKLQEKNGDMLDNNSVSVSILVGGTPDNAKNFLNKVGNVRRLLRISEANIRFPDNLDIAEVDMVVDAFFAPLPQTIGKPSDPLEEFTAAEQQVLNKLGTFPEMRFENSRHVVPVGGKTDPFTPFNLNSIDVVSSPAATQF